MMAPQHDGQQPPPPPPPPPPQPQAMGEQLGPAGQQQPQQGANGGGPGQWSSGVFQWLQDAESCWWSFWCPLLLFARTTARFSLHSDPYQLATQLIVAAAVAAVLTPLIGPLVSLASWVGFAVWRARYRGRLRESLGIQTGSSCEDFSLHCFCSPCAIAQEAREAKTRNTPAVEFCTGEPLLPPNADPTVASSPEEQQQSLLATVRKVSRCSRLILAGSGALMTAALLLSLLASAAPGNALILLLALLQPFLILYLVYWRSGKSRREASLDAVIKLFAVGFFLTAQFAAMAEPVVELLVVGIAAAAGLLPNFDPEKTTEADVQAWAKGHMPTVLFVMFMMAFFVAAGVEELFKYLALRFCTLGGGQPRSPHAILIYLVAAAAGFACCENIAYVFGVPSTMGGGVKGATAMFLGELQVLALRALMPVHVICAALQAIQWTKAACEESDQQNSISTLRILWPAILLHGTFDFSLMAIAACVFAFDLDEDLWGGVSLGIGLLLTVVGLGVAMLLWRRQQGRLLRGWQRVGDEGGVAVEISDSPPPAQRQQGQQEAPLTAAAPSSFPRSYQRMEEDDAVAAVV